LPDITVTTVPLCTLTPVNEKQPRSSVSLETAPGILTEAPDSGSWLLASTTRPDNPLAMPTADPNAGVGTPTSAQSDAGTADKKPRKHRMRAGIRGDMRGEVGLKDRNTA
jgi:hypothetical protein